MNDFDLDKDDLNLVYRVRRVLYNCNTRERISIRNRRVDRQKCGSLTTTYEPEALFEKLV